MNMATMCCCIKRPLGVRGFSRAMRSLWAPQRHDNLLSREELFEGLSDRIPMATGLRASRDERETKRLLNQSVYTYGEFRFRSFAETLHKLVSRFGDSRLRDGVFYDLGSGSGKAVVAACVLFPFRVACGIEYLESLHTLALQMQTHYMAAQVPHRSELLFLKGDFLQVDWSGADLVFANSTCFEPELMSRLAQRSERMSPGSFFVTVTRNLSHRHWKVVDSDVYRMSWGPARIFTHVKVC
eukprot:GILK01013736.1.p1 GENE.GILK01013736.1~~GILK01013736.1.p1  ORF type:complete len:241 (+),score=18.40 GILK01013736.1:46-768(+)